MSREELGALIKCPIDWISETGEEEGAVSLLRFDWYHCLNEHAVSADEHVTDPDGFDYEELGPEQLRRLIANLKLRERERIDCHKKRAGRLAGLQFRRPSKDGKHFIAGADKLYLQERSRGSISYFYTDYRSAELRAAFWSWPFMFFLAVASFQVYVEILTPGTEENVSYYGSFSIDSSIPTVRGGAACVL